MFFIVVNDELGSLNAFLAAIREGAIRAVRGGSGTDWLSPGARVALISFHSLEDRPVKWLFKNLAQKDRPILNVLTKKPLVPGEEEIARNPASRSSKLRVVEKIREEERHGA